MRNLTIVALLMGSSSVLAQTAQPTTMTDTATTAPQASSATDTADSMAGEAATSTTAPPTNSPTAVGMPAADTAVDASMSNDGMTATTTANTEPATAPTTTAAANWAADADRDGALTPLEFAMQVDSSNTALTAEAKRERFSRASGNGAIKLLNATAADFAKADRNRDRKIDATELAAWSGGASASAAPAATMTSGAGEMTPMPSAAPAAAGPADAGATMTSPDAGDAPEGQQADDTMAADTPPNN